MTVVLDKIPDGSGASLQLNVNVELSWKFKLRLLVGKLLVRMAAWIMNVGFETEIVEE